MKCFVAVASLVLTLIFIQHSQASFIVGGCYQVDVDNRIFVTSAGDYDPDDLDHASCAEECGLLDYQHAAVTGGRYCLCADTTISGADTGSCDIDCSGNAGENCGGARSLRVLEITLQRAAVQLNSTNEAFVVGQSKALEASLSGTATTASFDYGDGSPATDFDASIRSHVYAVPGQYVASIHAQNVLSSDFAAAQVTAYVAISDVALDCPEVVEPDESFNCSLTIQDGSDMTMSLSIGSSFYIGTPSMFAVGRVAQHAQSSLAFVAPAQDTIWILPGFEFLDTGTVRSLEVYASSSGQMQFLILRPTCTVPGNSYCLIDNQCSSSCSYDESLPTNPMYQDTCSTGTETYCLTQSRCVSTSNVNTCPSKPSRYVTDTVTAPRAQYTVKYIYDATASVGHNYFELPVSDRTFSANIGDVLGFAVRNAGAAVAYEDTTGSGEAVGYRVDSTTPTQDGVLSPVAPAFARQFQIRVAATEVLSASVEHSYRTIGMYPVVANVSNAVNAEGEVVEVEVAVQIPVINLTVALTPDVPYFSRESTVNLSVSIVAGDPITLEIDWGDGVTFNDTDVCKNFGHLYQISSGVVTITVTASNLHGAETATKTIYIQYPVKKEHYRIIPDSPASHPFPDATQNGYINITVELLAAGSDPYGTDPNITFSSSYYDNSSHVMTLKNQGDLESYTHNVQFPGTYTVSVIIENFINKVTFEERVELYGVISPDISLEVLYQPEIPPDGDPLPGFGYGGLQYPLERPIVFRPLLSSGTGILFEYLDFGDGSVPQNTTGDTYEHSYSTPGEYTTMVRASNPISGPYVISTTFELYRTIYGIEVSTGDTTTPNQPKNFTITVAQIGFNSCLAVDYGDQSALRIFGEEASCSGHPRYPAATYSGLLTNRIELQHTYGSNGSFVFIVHGFNLVSSVEIEEAFAVTYLSCNVPQVSISDGHVYYTHPREVEAFKYFSLSGIADIRCKINDNFKEWTVEEYNITSGEVLVDGLALNLTGLPSSSPYYIDDADTANILLSPSTYSPGYYIFTYCVTMDSSKLDSVVFTSCARDYVRVLPYELEVRVVAGQISSSTVGHGQIFTLDPEGNSRDPSLPADTIDQGFTSFKYYCRRFYEALRRNNDMSLDDTPVAIQYTEEPSDGGCFGTGPGRLDYDGGTLNLTTAWMNNNMTYSIQVVVSKGALSGQVEFELKVIDGDPPQPVISLSDGTPFTADSNSVLLNTNSDLRLKAGCNDQCHDVSYVWEVDYSNGTHSFTLDGWRQNATGYTTDSVFIPKEVFSIFPTAVSYTIRLLATTSGGVTGITEIRAEVNSPPAGYNCTVPSRQIALGDSTTITCHGWTDEDGIARYEFYATTDTTTLLDRGTLPSTVVYIPSSGADLNYTTQVYVLVIDSLGGAAKYSIGSVYVNPSDLTEDILTEDSVTSFESTYEELAAEENLEEITQKTLIDINALNIEKINTNVPIENEISRLQDMESNTENDTITTLIRSRIAATQEQVTPTSFEDVIALAGPVSLLSYATDELSGGTLDSLSNVMDKMVATCEEQSYQVSTETVTEATTRMIGILGNLLEGSALEVQGSQTILGEFENSNAQGFSALQSRISEATSASSSATATESPEAAAAEEQAIQQQKAEAKARVKNLEQTLQKVRSLLVRNTFAKEEPISYSSDTIAVTMSRDTAADVTGQQISQASGGVYLPPFLDVVDDPDLYRDATVDTQVTTLKVNPYNFEDSSDRISTESGVVDISFEVNGVAIPVTQAATPIEITVKRTSPAPDWQMFDLEDLEANNSTNVTYHTFDVSYNETAVTLQVRGGNQSCFALLLQGGGFPNFTHFLDARLFTYDRNSNGSVDYMVYEVFYNNSFIGDQADKYYVMLLELDCDALFRDYGDLDFADPQELVWAASNTSMNFTGPYGFRVLNSGCSFWNVAEQMWLQDGCEVEASTDYSEQQCKCTHLTSFSSTWIVPPTPLDFDYIFANAGFRQNLTMYITTIVIYVFFFIIFLWARRKDRKDLLKLGVTPMADNNARHNYYYEILVLTGQRKAAGTDSKVSFILSGESDETEVRQFEDDKRKILRRGGTDRFLMAVPRPLGTLNYMRIWHDNSGSGKMQGWYLKYIAIRDIQTRERFYFIVNQWFSVVEDDGQIDRLVPVAGREQMQNFSHLFSNHSRRNLNDGHLWFSILARPPGSRFTRLQRAACCMMFLWLEMLVNIMWYEVSPPAHAQNPINLGPLSLSPAQISIGVQANLIVFPVSLLVVQFFRKSRPRKKRQSRLKEAALAGKPARRFKRKNRKKAYTKLEDFASPSRIVLEESKQKMVNPVAGTRAEPSLVIPPIPGAYEEPPVLQHTAVQPGYSSSSSGSQPPPGSGDSTVLIQPDTPKRRKKFSFPWWCIIIAWLLVILSTAAATTVVIFYGIQFGELTVREWLASLFTTFIVGIFFTQPIKILLIAVFVACIIKSPNADDDSDIEEDEEEFDLNPDEEYLHTVSGHVTTKKRCLPYKPPDPEALERAREKRLKEIKMYAIFREIFFYVVYLWVVLMISYGNADPSSYRMQEDFVNELVIGDGVHSFNKVTCHHTFWVWLEQTFIPAIFPQTWYNGEPDPEVEGFLADQNAYIIGFAVLRQLRIKHGLCQVVKEFEGKIHNCTVSYSVSAEDNEDYGAGWTPYNNATIYRSEYNYTESSEIDSYPYLGRHGFYLGGGYVARLDGGLTATQSRLSQLYQEAWLDRYTRAVFVEMATYNAQVNLFGVITLLAEFLPTGGVETNYHINIIRLYNYAQGFGAVRLACEILFLGFVVFFIFRELNNMRREGVRVYFKSLWNFGEWVIIGCAIGATVIYFYRLYVTESLLSRFTDTNGAERINLQHVAYLNEILTYMLAIIVFIGTLKFIKLLRFNRRIGLLSSTIRSCFKDLVHFGIMFGIFFIAYALAFYQIYLRSLFNYSDFLYTLETLSTAILGKFDFVAIHDANRYLGPILFFFYMVTITFILINMFLTIVIEAFSSVKGDISRQSNEYEMVDFMLSTLKNWVGWSSKSKTTVPIETDTPAKKEDQDLMSEFPDKVEQLLDGIAKVYFDTAHFEDIIRGSGLGGSKSGDAFGPKKRPVKHAVTG
ncbi:uncharacterized protein [Diadema setosum]|uniref:uncharacterized protein n=1 Tax=Diadema setosum TaxID=31175 RepID=UPI003B3BE103